MGRCQGGFCSTRIIELLADRQQVNEEDITKHGIKTQLSLHKIGQKEHEIQMNGNLTEVTEYHPIPIEQSSPVIMSQNENMKEILNTNIADIIIVGAGPAGLAAGLSAMNNKKDAKVLILEKAERSGGILL